VCVREREGGGLRAVKDLTKGRERKRNFRNRGKDGRAREIFINRINEK